MNKSTTYLKVLVLLLLAGVMSQPLLAQGVAPNTIEHYSSAGNMNQQTSYAVAQYDAAIIGFQAIGGDIDELGTGNPIQVYMEEGTDGFWYVKADFYTHHNHEDWEIDVQFTWKGLSANAPGSTLAHQLMLPDIFAPGGKNLIIGDDAYFSDIDVPNTLALFGGQDPTFARLLVGSNGVTLTGKNTNFGVDIVSPTEKLHVKGNAFLQPDSWSSPGDKVRIQFGDEHNYVEAIKGTGMIIKGDGVIRTRGGFLVHETGDIQVTTGEVHIGGADLHLGRNDGRSVGALIEQRALTHWLGDTLVINTAGDFEGGTKVESNLLVTGSMHAWGTISGSNLTLTSDARYKQQVKPIANSLELVQQLQGVQYTWRTAEYPGKGFDKLQHRGFLAQDLEQVLPDAVHTDADGYKAVAYQELIAVLVEAIKEQQEQIGQLEQAQQGLEASLQTVTAALAAATSSEDATKQEAED